MTNYFTDRENGPKVRSAETINDRVWRGIYALIQSRLSDGGFGYRFPDQCPDGNGPIGCDWRAFERLLQAEVPDIEWPLDADTPPDTPVILDLLEFCAASVGLPVEGWYHSFYRHHHLSWEREPGLAAFVSDINRLFARNGLAFELTPEGEARRLLPAPLAASLASALFTTGDSETDQLLEQARKRISLPRIEDRKDALEKLWDAFERLKTLESGNGKREQAEALLDRAAAAGSQFRHMLGAEAKALTDIGNTFRIRHSEVGQESLTTPEQIDYLFTRMFAFIRQLLRTTGRGG